MDINNNFSYQLFFQIYFNFTDFLKYEPRTTIREIEFVYYEISSLKHLQSFNILNIKTMTKQNKQCCKKNHPDNSKELPRLNKIAGQINGIRKMIEDKRYCVEILQQLGAIKSAINSLQANLLETHLTNCVKESFELRNEADIEGKINELKEIFRKY